MAARNADLSRFAVVHGGAMDWQPSPTDGVARKRLYHDGSAERGRVTSIVRFDPGARFPMHDHPEGEEVLVLDGVFSDDSGDYGAGSFLLNPDGSRHAPWSDPGCLLFVKLRQYTDPEQVALDTDTLPWQPGRVDGVKIRWLYRNANDSVTKRLVKLDPGTEIPDHGHPGGEEIFVLAGDITDDDGQYGVHCWARYPVGKRHRVRTGNGCLLYVQTGGFG